MWADGHSGTLLLGKLFCCSEDLVTFWQFDSVSRFIVFCWSLPWLFPWLRSFFLFFLFFVIYVVPHLLENSSIHIELNPQLCFASVEICRSCVEPAVFSPPQLRRVFLAAHKHLQLRFLDVLVVISHGAKRRPKKKKSRKRPLLII